MATTGRLLELGGDIEVAGQNYAPSELCVKEGVRSDSCFWRVVMA
jgi:hypothetical protein